MKENLRMQFLAGLITESEYKHFLNEDANSSLIVNIYSPTDQGYSGLDGFIDLDSKKYFVNYNLTPPELLIGAYTKSGMPTPIVSLEDENKMISYLESFNISYETLKVSYGGGGKWIKIYDVPSQNIEMKYGAIEPNFKKKSNNKTNLKTLDFFIKRDNPELLDEYEAGDFIGGNVYDFGGGEGPIDDPQAVVVDLYLNSKQKQNPTKFIEADLSKYVKLPPKDAINIFSSVAQINSPNNLSKTIKSALNPGGLLVIKDHIGAVQDLLKYLKDFKLLTISYMDAEDPKDITLSDQIYAVLKK
jgi:hypothetical protein